MAVFYICRHGETENNRDKRLSGWIDTPLTDTGLLPAEKAITRFKGIHFDGLFSSDLGRAFVTAYVIARGLNFTETIVRLPELREVNYGDVAHMKSVKAYAMYPKLDRDAYYTPTNGESLAHMQQRVIETLSDLHNAHPGAGETLLIIAHSGTMAALNASYLGHNLGEHNISVPYSHEYVARCTVEDKTVTSFEEVLY